MTAQDYLTARRIETRLRREARVRGLSGDPLATCADVADTLAEQLTAVNIAERATGRPRWRIPRDAWERFRAARSNSKSDPPRRRTRRHQSSTDVQYY